MDGKDARLMCRVSRLVSRVMCRIVLGGTGYTATNMIVLGRTPFKSCEAVGRMIEVSAQ